MYVHLLESQEEDSSAVLDPIQAKLNRLKAPRTVIHYVRAETNSDECRSSVHADAYNGLDLKATLRQFPSHVSNLPSHLGFAFLRYPIQGE